MREDAARRAEDDELRARAAAVPRERLEEARPPDAREPLALPAGDRLRDEPLAELVERRTFAEAPFCVLRAALMAVFLVCEGQRYGLHTR
ncbi:MAG: hypothetical protein QMC79_03885 [Anaerosomatales bacterium]|nr:hypothetical protein [Anaerosomatales bacterium]